MRRPFPPLSRPRVIGAVTTAALALAGCGASGGSSLSAFRSSFSGQRPKLRSLSAAVQTQILTPHAGTDSALAALATRAVRLSAMAQQEAGAAAGLSSPVAYNTRLRDLHAALTAVADDLAGLATVAGDHNRAATAAALTGLRADAGGLTAVETKLSHDLGL